MELSEQAGAVTGIDIVADGYVTKAEPPPASPAEKEFPNDRRTVKYEHGRSNPEHL